MKIGIFITARLGSSRLEKKHLLPVRGKPILSFLIERARTEFQGEIEVGKVGLVIVTSDEPENRKFEDFRTHGTAVFYGAIHNIPLRHLQAAKELGFNSIISVDGDDILCSVKGMRAVHDALSAGADYAKTIGLPFGMNCHGYRTAFLETSLQGHENSVLETGWTRLFDTSSKREIEVDFPIQNELLRFTLDYKEDYIFFKALIEKLGDNLTTALDLEIVQMVLKNGFQDLNGFIAKEYWENFHRSQQREAISSSHYSS